MSEQIRQGAHRVPYEQLARVVLQNKQLSFGARGLWAYMRSMPDTWRWNEKHLVDSSPEGRDALRAKLKELVDAGLLTKERESKTKPGVVWTIHHLPRSSQTENPSDWNSVGRDFSRTGNQSDWKPVDIEKTQSLREDTVFRENKPPCKSPHGGDTHRGKTETASKSQGLRT